MKGKFKIILPERYTIKLRKILPPHSATRVEKDKTKVLPRNAKYKQIEV